MPQNTELFFQESEKDGSVAYTVTELSLTLKQYIEGNFNQVEVRGEVSGVTLASSGHLYFSLKDENALLKAVCWRYVVSKLSVSIEEGLDVICKGNITTYPGRSYYQINIESIKPAGQGALLAMLEKRKKKFEKEGLFDESRKKLLPKMPRRIGIVTSSKGAVIKDILHRIEDRFPLHVMIWDVQVQGNESAVQVAQAIEGFNNILDQNKVPDIIIVARGGGSIEDLWSFNEEIVIRAVADSKIPIISAIGHETDFTLIDYVADKRAPTPTAAAEIAVPVKEDLVQYLKKHRNTLFNVLPRLITIKAAEIQKLSALLEKFTERFIEARYLLKRYNYKIETLFKNIFLLCKNKIDFVKSHIKPLMLDNLIEQNKLTFNEKEQIIKKNINSILKIKQQSTESSKKLLISYNHKNILKRGFSIVRNQKTKIINSANLLQDKELINIEFYDGQHKAVIKNKVKKEKSSTTQVKLPF